MSYIIKPSERRNGQACHLPMTARQRQAFDFIVACIRKGRAPRIREIGAHMGISSPNGVIAHLNALEARGLIERGEKEACGIYLVGCTLVIEYDETPEGERARKEIEGTEK